MTFILSKNTDEDFVVTTSLYLHSLEVLISSILYNPALSLAILDGHDWTQQFFANWFKNLPKMTRVHDKKMTIAAICALLEWLATVGVGAPLAQSSSQLVVGAIQVFRELPSALASESTALTSTRL
jgi:importin-7